MLRPIFSLLGLCALVALPTLAHADNEITSSKNPVAPGETIKLRWLFTGNRVTLSGGRFGKGTVVTGKSSITDAPRKTTRYTFTTEYTSVTNDPQTGAVKKTPAKSVYSIVIEVETPGAGLLTYRAARGWQVNYRSGWKHDHVNTPDEGRDGLVFFQKEDDSIERLAVAVMAAKEMTLPELVQKVKADMPQRYNDLTIMSEEQTTFQGVQAVRLNFMGRDQAHPNTLAQSLVVAFVREGRAFVVSARTAAAQYEARKTLMDRMVRSFRLMGSGVTAMK